MFEGNMVIKEEEEENGIYVGRTVKKFFLGFGYFHGKVISFNRSRKFYKVKYDDGDREELDFKELKEVLVDDDCKETQPLRLPSSTVKPMSSGRRGRKRKRDSAEKDISAGVLGEDHHDNGPIKNSPLRLEEVKVLNAQTKEIYKQLKGSNDGGKDGTLQGEELLLEPLVPVSLENAFDKSVKQPEFEFNMAEEDEAWRRAEACGNGNHVPAFKPSSCRRKRARVSPTSNSCLQHPQIPSVVQVTGRNEEGDTKKPVDETAMTIADAPLPLPSVKTEVEAPLSDVGSDLDHGKDHEGGEGHEQEEKTQFSAFVLSLPPSSRTLGGLDECVAELFQVYSLLRSFSNLIFLSPFSLEEFAYSLVSTEVCALTDCIHLSLLQILRRQLERLSKNGSKSATFTLRLSDWSLLDFVTWPSFLVGYMLTQGFNFGRDRHSFVKSSLATPVEYYKQPVRAKLAVLSFLSDKVLDTDEGRAELARRILLENDPETMETKGFAQRKHMNQSTFENETLANGVGSEPLSPSGADAVRVGRHLDEDGNLDECVLCAMDGNLICCDGCPAAYHSRCVGVTKQGLPPGDWFCPECRADEHDSRGSRIPKRVRGGELLAIGPEGQYFYNACGYLLISEAGPGGQVMHRYYGPRDLHTVIQLLEEAGPSYSEVQNALQQFYQVDTLIKMAREASPKAASALEAPLIVVSASENGADHTAGECNNILLGKEEVPDDVEKSSLAGDSLTPEQTKHMSHMSSTAANCEPVISSLKEHDLKQALNASNSSNYTNGLRPTSNVVGPPTGEGENKPSVYSHEPGKAGHDELQCGLKDKSLSAELETIWEQHSSDDALKQVILKKTDSQSNGQVNVEGKIENATESVSTGVKSVEPVRNGATVGDVKDSKNIGLGTAQQELNSDLALTSVSASATRLFPKEELPEQRDEPGGSGKPFKSGAKPGHIEGGSLEKEVDYLSTITQINACSYKNKYANCDLVATAAFNLAVMAGGVDDLVDDRSGSMKKSKPSSIADYVKAFTQASSPFFWPSVKKRGKDVPKEKCGWCINCRLPVRRGCLLTQVVAQMAGGAALVVGGIRSLKGGIGHFPAVAAYILYMEENLHGLLVGPWEYAGHRKKWRKQVEQAKSLNDVKRAVLEMESSMRKVVLSADWDKVEEDFPESIASSAVIINTASVPAGKKAAPTRKRGRPSVVARPPPVNSYDGACFGVRWWRGGSLSRKVYNWESLTRTSLRRAGRQGGFKEIPGLVYSKSLDLPRRTRRFAWRTRVEKTSSIAQLAAEVRYLDTFIKWNDIISRLQATTTHNVKGPVGSDPAFHKAEVRAKKDESGVVEYLLGFPTEIEEKIDASTQQLEEVPPKGAGASAEKPSNKKQQAPSYEVKDDVWVAESQVPLFLLKTYVEKLRTENQIEMPKKKGKLKGSNQQKKLSFWNLLCNPRLAAPTESKKLSGWVCGHCNLNCSKSQHVRCHRCKGHFHKKCTQLEDSINGQEEVPVCKSCVQSRLGQRMRKPSYKMLAMQSQMLSDGTPAAYSKEAVVAGKAETFPGRGKLRCKRDRPVSSSPQDYKLFGKKKKKRLLSVPTPSQLDCESIWIEKKGKKQKKTLKRKGFTTVFPCQYDGEPTRVGKKKMKKRALPIGDEKTDLPQPKKRGRKRKQDTLSPQEKRRSGRIRSVSSSPSQAERKQEAPPQGRRRSGRIRSVSSSPSQVEPNQDTSPQERRTSGRIRNCISPNAVNCLSIIEQPQVPRRYKKKYKLDEESPGKSMSTKRRKGRRMDNLAADDDDDDDDDGGDEVVIKLPLKRKRLKIIFDGLEVGRQAVNGGADEGRQRKSGNGLDFGNRLSKSEAEIQTFRQERLVLEGNVGLDGGKLPRCGICSVPYAPGHVYVSCEYCEGWYHGAAMGLRKEDAPHLMGFKCHRCRKCRAPPCPFRQNAGGGKPRRGGAIDHGEVIDAENVNRTGQGQLDSVSLQSSWFSSPDKDFSAAFSDAKAFPDFVAATNQAEEALAADGSTFGHDVLSSDFDMNDLVLAGDPQVQLNPLSLEDQQMNVWTNNDSAQLHLRPFSVSQADISSEAAPPLSFTELLASEDDLFEGVAGPGLVLGAEWSGGIYGSGSLVPHKPLVAGSTTNAGVDNYSSLVNANGTISSGSGNFDTPLKTHATDIARIDDYSSYAGVNGAECQTPLPSKQC
ncbi:unnamed protein product [Calypogeia fissa]